MTEAFDASGREEAAINEIVVRADNRDKIDASLEAAVGAKESEELLGHTESVWNSLGFEYDFSELENTMGSTWDTTGKILLARVPTGLGVREVVRPIQFGARRITCSRTFTGSSGSDLKALHGEVLMYRTYNPRRDSTSEQFVDRGFYCFVIQAEHDKTGQLSPAVVFGDLDGVEWPRNSFKSLFVYSHLRDGRDASDYFSHSDQDSNLSLKFKDRLFREDLTKGGIFRQNQTPIISDETDPLVRYQLRERMQVFIDEYLDPEQTKPEVVKQAQDRIYTASQIYGLAGAAALTDFDISHAALQIRQERDASSIRTLASQRINKIKSQIKQPNIKYLSNSRLEEEVVRRETNFPLVQAIRIASPHCEPMSFNQIVYELVGSKSGNALVERLMHPELTQAEIVKVHKLDGSTARHAMFQGMIDHIRNRDQ